MDKKRKENSHKEEMERIATEINCSKGYRCQKTEFAGLEKLKVLGDGELIECGDSCSEGTVEKCGFKVEFGDSHFCVCPLQIYVAKNFK